MAEARRIHNKYHSNPAEKDSDSELSVLTTSLFNGMEGIEIGRGSGSEIQGYIGSNSTVFGGDSKVKASRYSRVLRKKTNGLGIALDFKGCRLDILKVLGYMLDICR